MVDGRGGAPIDDAAIVVDRGVIRCAGPAGHLPHLGCAVP